jgi:hypothetical protein
MIRRAIWIGSLLLICGCDDALDPPVATNKKSSSGTLTTAPATTKPREILGKRTQDVRDASAEVANKGATIASPRPIAKEPFALAGNTYVNAIGQISINNIKHAVDLYQATEGEYPKTHQEFMEKIIKGNNIALPTLPYYQEYSYDVKSHQLMILEYPDRKAAGR